MSVSLATPNNYRLCELILPSIQDSSTAFLDAPSKQRYLLKMQATAGIYGAPEVALYNLRISFAEWGTLELMLSNGDAPTHITLQEISWPWRLICHTNPTKLKATPQFPPTSAKASGNDWESGSSTYSVVTAED